jgi:hypothetical protein
MEIARKYDSRVTIIRGKTELENISKLFYVLEILG